MVIPSITSQFNKQLDGRNKIVLQPLDQQPAPGTNNYYPAITSISTEPRPDGSEKVFVETFLIDAVSAPNKKGWRVSYDNPADFDRRVQDSKNHPLVLFQTPHPTKDGEMIFDHPVAPITSLEAAADPLRATIEFQKKYTIGYARHFKKVKDGVWHAVYEIVNPKAKKFFKNAKEKGLKLFTSPHIVRPTAENDRTNIKEWALIHNAIVSNPAHNEAIASIKKIASVVARKAIDFSSLFASMDTPDAEEDTYTELLNADELLELVTSHHNNEASNLIMPEIASTAAMGVNPSITATESINTVPDVAKTPMEHVDSVNLKSTITSLSNEPDNKPKDEQKTQEENKQEQEKDARIAELQARLKDIETKYAQDQRKSSVEKIFAPVVSQLFVDAKTGILDEKAYNAEVKKYANSNLSYEEIQEIIEAKFIKAQAASFKQERASLTSQVNEMASIPYTKMQTNHGSNPSTGIEYSVPLGLSILKRLQGAKLD
jgi:hypothetical protein